MELFPTHTDWRPHWWTHEMEPIIKVVRAYRDEANILYGQVDTAPDCSLEEGGGYFVFGVLTRDPDFLGHWEMLLNPDYLQLALARVRSGPPRPIQPEVLETAV